MSTGLKTELVKAADIAPPQTAPGPVIPAVINDAVKAGKGALGVRPWRPLGSDRFRIFSAQAEGEFLIPWGLVPRGQWGQTPRSY